MLVLIWAAVFFSVRGSNAYSGSEIWGKQQCSNGFCITLNERKITAEAGLCVMIPCSFTTCYGFKPEHLVWYKCEPFKWRCGDSDVIFHTNKKNKKVQSEFKGRVSLVEPDVSQNNCSIMITDLKQSDSGVYQLRVNGLLHGTADGFTFSPKATLSVKGLNQKPTVMIPPLTEGQQATLTCTAPGLCSGSKPAITWMWRGAGDKDSAITHNITAETSNLTAFTCRHSSSLTFNPSAEHHKTNVTCKINFAGDTTTEETVTLIVNYMREVKITGNRTVEEGDVLNLTCSVDSFPPSKISLSKFQTVTYPEGVNLTDTRNNTATYLQEERGSFFISNVTAEDSGLYVCTAEHLNNTMTEGINVTVIYTRKPQITGNTTVKKGDVLNLTCSVDSFPPSKISWSKFQTVTYPEGVNLTDTRNNTATYLQEERGSFFISNVTAEDSGLYVCSAEHLNNTMTEGINVTVIWFSEILKASGCVLKAEILTCVCISQGSPLPTIKWPLLKDYTEYSAITTVSYHTVNSSVTLNVKHHDNITVECISSNENGEAKENLIIQKVLLEKEGDRSKNLLGTLSWLEIIIAFLVGVVLTTIICCLAMKCYRKKQRNHGILDETLEMVTSQDDPVICDGQIIQDHDTHAQEGAENGAVVTEKAVPELNLEAKEVVYANIDFSLLKSKSPTEAAREQEDRETEYAEIKTQVKDEREDDDGEEYGILMDKEEEDEETHHCVPEEEKEEEAEEAVYSTVKELMDEI